ncbi:MAG: DeoR/GlpR family DNA-binding transcription regulator [Planctomycetes bacterium]|nr:DeoR/GlpR family DNA-binding transcription regulator [Planctomycetota bacterium]
MNTVITGDKNQVQRRTVILDTLNRHGVLRVLELSKDLGVSAVTIRKDLEELEQAGFLVRTHGGAHKLQADEQVAVDYESRMQVKREEKKRIAAAAADCINEGDFVIVNVGTTCSYVSEELKSKKRLTVVTNALQILNNLSSCPWISTIFLGGRFNTDMQISVGDEVTEQLGKYIADKLIMGMDGVDLEMGATTYNHVEDSIMRQMIARAKERILVVDDSKIGRVSFARIADLTDFHTIVTNHTDANAAALDQMRRRGIKVIAV